MLVVSDNWIRFEQISADRVCYRFVLNNIIKCAFSINPFRHGLYLVTMTFGRQRPKIKHHLLLKTLDVLNRPNTLQLLVLAYFELQLNTFCVF